MFKFNYYNPTQIVFGEDRIAELDQHVPKDAKVMIVYGGGSAKKFGTIDKVAQALGNRKTIEFSGVEPNPRFETLLKGVELANEEGIDFLLAVGGGSVMDGTKFIALAMHYDKEPQDILFHGFKGVPATKSTAIGCIVTLPATGSEMNMGAVITYDEQKYVLMSPLVFPKFSFLDPLLTKTLPKEQIANGVADAFVHVVEQYITYPVDARVQDRMSEGILKTLIEVGPVTYNDNQDMSARKNFMWSATNALNGILAPGVPQDWATHMIGHEITSVFGIAHGRTLAIILPYLLRARKDKKREKLLQYAERVWDISSGKDDEKIDQAINKTEEFFNSLGIVTNLSHYGIDDNGIDTVIANMEKMGLTALSETRDLGPEAIREILHAAR
ncbi:MAG: iron-containing alcohol dehydrogenase [Gammaproteobacteria bacterium]|nr:MAG: iron-containing alcohol dehydrogenase [Gammaproteobacteria bacterium]